MGISTNTGNNGMTSLSGGERVSKDDIRVWAYGTIDELSSVIGLLITYCACSSDSRFLVQIQEDLFRIAGYLATDRKTTHISEQCLLQESQVTQLEEHINSIEIHLPPLYRFVFPGGSRGAALSHVCRTVCRRAERHIVALLKEEKYPEDTAVLKYINLLSDFFFLLARKLNIESGLEEICYGPSKKQFGE